MLAYCEMLMVLSTFVFIQQLSIGHEFTLSMLTYFGCVLSLVCLLAAFCTFQFFKYAFFNIVFQTRSLELHHVRSELLMKMVSTQCCVISCSC